MTKTIETQNYLIHIDKYLDKLYIQISTKDKFVTDVLDNIMVYSRQNGMDKRRH